MGFQVGLEVNHIDLNNSKHFCSEQNHVEQLYANCLHENCTENSHMEAENAHFEKENTTAQTINF